MYYLNAWYDTCGIYVCGMYFSCIVRVYELHMYLCISQVGFAEFNNTADNRANIGGTIIGAPIVGQ